MGAPYPPADEARQRAEEILARPEFAPPEKSWLEEALEWVDETVRSFFNSLLAGGAGSIIAWVILAVLVAIVIVVVARITRTMQVVPTHAVEQPISSRRSAVNWRAEAERLEAEGNWKDGIAVSVPVARRRS